ncbi:MAG TPA: HNH endonuclease [Bacillota bacterium]|nr:HNH endonuclease [Bacillota bacterium]
MKNQFEIQGDRTLIHVRYKVLYLNAWIDTKDLPLASSFPGTWVAEYSQTAQRYYIHGRLYANGTSKKVYLHRWLVSCPDDLVVDHIDGDSLNNLRSNLRTVTSAQNAQNKKLYTTNQSGVPGLTWDKAKGKWRVQFSINGKCKYFGSYFEFHDAEKVARDIYKNLPFHRENEQKRKKEKIITLFDFEYID